MEKPSSTSSSEIRRGDWIPWGLLGAVLIVGCAECTLRQWHPSGEVPYALSSQEYRALPYELDARGAAQIAVVGSSRAREGFSAPTMAKSLRDHLGKDLSVGGYAVAGGRANGVRQIVDRLVAADPPPQIVLYGISPRQVTPKAKRYAGRSKMWTLSDWWSVRLREGAGLTRYLGQATRYTLGRVLYLFRYEPQIREALAQEGNEREQLRIALTDSPGHDISPMRGRHTDWQTNRAFRTRKVSQKKALAYLKKVTGGSALELSEELVDVMATTLDVLRAHDIEVVLYEVPVHKELERAYDKGTMTQLDGMMARLSEESGVAYLSTEDLGLQFEHRDFREQSHLNLRGARKLTTGLTEVVVLPWLEGRGPAARPAN